MTQERSKAMGNKRNRRREYSEDLDASGTDEAPTNNGISPSSARVHENEAVGQNGHSNHNGQNGVRNGKSQASQTPGESSSQFKQSHRLLPWTQAVSEAANSMKTTQQAFSDLQKIFATHQKDLMDFEGVKRRLDALTEECSEKDEVIEHKDITIKELRGQDHRSRADIEAKLEEIAQRREELEKAKEKQQKSEAAKEAELKLEAEHVLKKHVEEQDRLYKTRLEELETQFAQRTSNWTNQVNSLEAANSRLLATSKQDKGVITSQGKDLETLKENYDVLNRAKDSFRTDALKLQKELQAIKDEFSINAKPASYLYILWRSMAGKKANEMQRTNLYSNIQSDKRYFSNILSGLSWKGRQSSTLIWKAHAHRTVGRG